MLLAPQPAEQAAERVNDSGAARTYECRERRRRPNQPSMARARWVIASSSRQVAEAVTSAAGRGCADRRSSRRVSASTASARRGRSAGRAPTRGIPTGGTSPAPDRCRPDETGVLFPHSYMRCNAHHHRGYNGIDDCRTRHASCHMSLAAVLLAVVALLVGCALGWTAHAARGGSELAAARAEAATCGPRIRWPRHHLAAASGTPPATVGDHRVRGGPPRRSTTQHPQPARRGTAPGGTLQPHQRLRGGCPSRSGHASDIAPATGPDPRAD